jgi:hypothetical protein
MGLARSVDCHLSLMPFPLLRQFLKSGSFGGQRPALSTAGTTTFANFGGSFSGWLWSAGTDGATAIVWAGLEPLSGSDATPSGSSADEVEDPVSTGDSFADSAGICAGTLWSAGVATAWAGLERLCSRGCDTNRGRQRRRLGGQRRHRRDRIHPGIYLPLGSAAQETKNTPEKAKRHHEWNDPPVGAYFIIPV